MAIPSKSMNLDFPRHQQFYTVLYVNGERVFITLPLVDAKIDMPPSDYSRYGIVNYPMYFSGELDGRFEYSLDSPLLSFPEIEKVIFNEPATIVYWKDGEKTVVKANDEPFDKEKGLAMAITKKVYGNKGSFNEIFRKFGAV